MKQRTINQLEVVPGMVIMAILAVVLGRSSMPFLTVAAIIIAVAGSYTGLVWLSRQYRDHRRSGQA